MTKFAPPIGEPPAVQFSAPSGCRSTASYQRGTQSTARSG
jgi:hypothetical protein